MWANEWANERVALYKYLAFEGYWIPEEWDQGLRGLDVSFFIAECLLYGQCNVNPDRHKAEAFCLYALVYEIFFPHKGKSILLESSYLAKLTCVDDARLIISELQLQVAKRECHFYFHVHRMIDWEIFFISRHPVGKIANFHDHQGMKQMGDEWKHSSRALIDNAKNLGVRNFVLWIVVWRLALCYA